MKHSISKQPLGKVIIPAGVNPWPHELRVAKILAEARHIVEFIPKGNIKSADILVDGIEYEIKSPRTMNANSLEHVIKGALRQSQNLIIDSSRIKHAQTHKLCNFLIHQTKSRKQIKNMLLITKQEEIIDILSLS